MSQASEDPWKDPRKYPRKDPRKDSRKNTPLVRSYLTMFCTIMRKIHFVIIFLTRWTFEVNFERFRRSILYCVKRTPSTDWLSIIVIQVIAELASRILAVAANPAPSLTSYDTSIPTSKRNAELINSLLGIPKAMNEAGRRWIQYPDHAFDLDEKKLRKWQNIPPSAIRLD